MDKKKDICELWQKASSLISDVSKSANMTSNIKTLENNGERLKERAKMMMNHLIKLANTFYVQLEKSVETIVGQKKALLEYHALEVQQYVTHIKTLCNTAECYLQGYSVHIAQYGPKLKTELELCIEQAGEFNSIDYETFTNLELEPNLDNLMKVPLCNIVNRNKLNQEKQVLEAIYLDKSLLIDLLDIDSSGTKEPQNNLANNTDAVAEMVVKSSDSFPKLLDENRNNTVIASNSFTLPNNTTNSSSLPNNTANILSKTSPPIEETKTSNDQIQYCKDLEKKTETKELNTVTISPSLSSNTSSLPSKQVSNVQEGSLKNSRVDADEPTSKTPSVSSNFIGTSANQHLVKSITDDFAACKITSKLEVKDEIDEQPSTATGNSIEMRFDLRTFMKTSPYSANEIEAQLIRRIKDYGDGTFDHPTGLTVNKDGQLLVTDTGNNMVKALEDNRLVFTIGDKDGVDFHRPSAVVCDAVGNIYVKDDKSIRMFNSKGNYLHTIGKGVLQYPYGLSLAEVDDDNVLVLIDHGRRAQLVYHYNIRLDELTSYKYEPLIQFGQPTSKVRFLATYKDLMLASDLGASCMYLSTTKGECLSAFGSFGYHAGHFKEPSGVTVDCMGNWIVGDSKNNRLQIFNKDGDFLAHIKLSCPIRRPSGIHLTNDGKLFVINYLDSEILVFQLY